MRICAHLEGLIRWAYKHGVELSFSRPGKPTDNDDAREKIEAWRRGYNETRPHGSLGWATPAEYACRAARLLTTKGPEISTSERS